MKKISQATGINEATVASTHRYLRDRGLITKGGRGTSSAKMAPSDAANLVIALLAMTAINDSPDVAERYGQLLVRKFGGINKLANFWPEGETQNFVVCVSRIFESFASGQVAGAVSKIKGESVSTTDLCFKNISVQIGIKRPEPEASVRLCAVAGQDEAVHELPIIDLLFERSFDTSGLLQANINPPISMEEVAAGLKDYRWIDLSVVKAISEIL